MNLKLMFSAAAFVLVSASASAAVIDFEDVAQPAGSNTIGGDVTSRGFLFDSATGHSHLVNNNFNSFNGTTWLGWDNNVGRETVTVSPVAGGTFNLTSLQLTEFFCEAPCDGSNGARTIRFTGNLFGGGTVGIDVDLDLVADGAGTANDFQTVNFNWNNLTSFTMASIAGGGDQWFAVDNVVINGTVPEPGTLALLGLGLAGLAASRRRKR